MEFDEHALTAFGVEIVVEPAVPSIFTTPIPVVGVDKSPCGIYAVTVLPRLTAKELDGMHAAILLVLFVTISAEQLLLLTLRPLSFTQTE